MALFSPGLAQAQSTAVPQRLTEAASELNTQNLIKLVLTDAHPLFGGVRFELETSGVLTRIDVPVAGQKPVRTTLRLSDSQADKLITAIEEARGWQQVEPSRMAVPDESQTVLQIQAGDFQSSVWEWTNDLTANNRLVRVQRTLNDLMPAGAP